MPPRLRHLAAGLASLQIVETMASATPPMSMADRLDHLGLPERLRPVLPVIKIATSVGLVAGVGRPRIGAVTCAGLVGFYAAAVSFHRLAGDPLPAALPAAALGAIAALCLVGHFLPVLEAHHLDVLE
jgi:hypothetical protein